MNFIHDDFMLDTEQAKALYHDYAKDLPIIDYHCHLPPEQVGDNTQFENLYQVWLAGDHYKWRAMRTNGVSEHYCTGGASDWEKFKKWAETVPYTLRNPLYHWTHLELRKPFGITDRLLNGDNAKRTWDECNEMLASPEFSARGLIEQAKVKVVCTTDDPIHDLAHHRKVASDSSFKSSMLPTWRPDRAMAAEDPKSYNEYLDRLAAVSDIQISSFDDLRSALQKRHDYFHEQGCRLSDHGLETVVAAEFTDQEVKDIFSKVRSGKSLGSEELEKFQSAMLIEFAVQDHAKGWVQQYHIGPIRNNNPRLFREAGPDTGFDSIGDQNYAKPLAKFLGRLDDQNQLAKTILYNINPRDNEMIGTMIGNFQDGSVPGKVQFGSGWWFNDQMDGMTRQIDALSQLGLLSRFVGMLTDSRSFLSYSRHEYFRRLLCRLLGRDMVNGFVPDDLQMVGKLVSDVSYYNARDYFPFKVPE
ncbi:glucuronate isomerase [Marinimicrobium sp. ABcell2]|uniref:glucuronate isomerase n=1 Tax=Marinimicrobium sp. ABcell2 TaxID=3069751 RepID=UPI0027AF8020|nr:glucuronate isomerase [Marinimicrobium sp. ABcell2]MDQ2078245.1 glucuronate isomerase [Marinimicrobium sp. ABcell2]